MRSSIPLFVAFAGAALAAPTATIGRRADMCGQWDSVKTGSYTLYQDLWGMSSATSGSQCSGVDSLSGTTLAWHTKWTWAGGSSSVKSYANAVVSMTPTKISSLTSLKTTWKWSYTGTSVVANVAYDAFLSSSSSGSAQYELMIWLAALGGAGPISSTGSSVATVTIDSVSWKLYSGYNGSMKVFSFVASSSATSFSGDVMNFIKYLTTNQGVSTSQYLQSIGAGTETFTGTSATFKTSAYSVVVK